MRPYAMGPYAVTKVRALCERLAAGSEASLFKVEQAAHSIRILVGRDRSRDTCYAMLCYAMS